MGAVQWLWAFTHSPAITPNCTFHYISGAVVTLPDTRSRGRLFSISLLSSNCFSLESFKRLAEQISSSATFPRYLFSLAYSYGWRVSRCSSFIVLLAFSFPPNNKSPFSAAYKQRFIRMESSCSFLPVLLSTGKCDGGKVLGYWEYKRSTCDCN